MSMPGGELTRRELRERERFLESRGMAVTEASILGLTEAQLAVDRAAREQSSAVDTQALDPGSVQSAPVQPPAPQPVAAQVPQAAPAAAPHPLSRRERRQLEADAAPIAVVASVPAAISQPPASPTPAPSTSETEESTNVLYETGGIPRWADALDLPQDVDPHEIRVPQAEDEPVATIPATGAIDLVTDSSQIILNEMPDLHTGQTEHLATGSIVLPPTLSEIGLPSEEQVAEQNEELHLHEVEELTHTGMRPVAAADAISWSTDSPEMVRPEEPSATKSHSTFLVIAVSLAGTALVALGVAVLMQLI